MFHRFLFVSLSFLGYGSAFIMSSIAGMMIYHGVPLWIPALLILEATVNCLFGFWAGDKAAEWK